MGLITKNIGTRIGTTAVCTYPLGESLVGAWDMAGNVFEWSRGEVASAPRVLRGGAFPSPRRSARCSYRVGDYPDSRLNFIGFRVVLSPFLCPLKL